MTPTPATPIAESTAPTSKTTFPHLWEAVAWLGTGLVLGTVLSVVFVLRRLEGDDFGIGLLALAPSRGVWQLLLVMAVIVAATMFVRDWDRLNPDPDGRVNSTFFVFLGTVLAILLFVMWIELPRASFTFTARVFDEPYGVSPDEVGHWGLSVPLLVGIVLLLASRRWPRTSPWKWWTVPFAVGTALALLADPAVRALSEYVPTEHAFLVRVPAESAPYPGSVSQPGWEWQAPGETTVLRVERGPQGPVIAITDGLVGLDGRTGEELWSYRRPSGSVSTAVQAGADRAHVVLYSEPASPRSRDAVADSLRSGRVIVLDTATGEVVEEFDRALEDPGDSFVRVLPEHTAWVRGRNSSLHLEVRGVNGEESLWRFSVPTGKDDMEEGMVCGAERAELYTDGSGRNVLLRVDQILVGYKCADPDDFDDEWQAQELLDTRDERFSARLLSLDPRTGAQNWHRAWDGPVRALYLDDGGPALNEGAGPVITVAGLSDQGTVVLDAADGSDVMAVAGEEEGPSRSVVHADTGGAVVSASEEAWVDQEREDWDQVFHRFDTSGEVSGVVRLPAGEWAGERPSASAYRGPAVVLAGGVALPFRDAADPDPGGTPSLLAAPFKDTDSGPGQATGGASLLAGVAEHWEEPERGFEEEPRPTAVLVPGAVVSYTTHVGERVYGWQP
ncbi:hypothetical protein GCM10009642_06590 [Nocardiopsis metallicus]